MLKYLNRYIYSNDIEFIYLFVARFLFVEVKYTRIIPTFNFKR